MELKDKLNMKMLPFIPIILGPTSSGKTSLALSLAPKFNAEVISVDSRQMYKYMDVGTGKLPVNSDIIVEKNGEYWVLDEVKVWGYDLVSPDEVFSGYDFALFALNKTEELRDSGKNVFIVGGTGFYIDLITSRVTPLNIEPDFSLRKELEALSLDELKLKLTSLNVEGVERLDLDNPVRIIRAIEAHLGTKKNLAPLPYFTDTPFKYIGLKSDNSFLYERADAWADFIWKNGLTDEVKNLIKQGFGDSPKLHGLVYKTVLQYLNTSKSPGTLSENEAIQLIKYDLHAYIRRQLTYFKRNREIAWFDINSGDYAKNIYNLING